MQAWRDFIQTLDFAELVPAAYADYAPAVRAGFQHFLARLPKERASEVLLGQMVLPEDAPLSARLSLIARSCPALHKFGQVMARDIRLDDSLRRHLQTLESLPSTFDLDEARALIEAELGDLAARGVTMSEAPLAEASVAVVVPFTQTRGETTRHGVFKCLKPGIEARLHEDLALLVEVGEVFEARCAELNLPSAAYRATVHEVGQMLTAELDLREEQTALGEAAGRYAALSYVRVPQAFPDLCTKRVTAMQRIDGVSISNVRKLEADIRRRVVDRLIESVVALPIWADDADAPFHADPHAGNLFLTPKGDLALLDWSLTGRLSKRERVGMTRVLTGALTCHTQQIVGAIAEDLAAQPVDRSALFKVVDGHVRDVRKGALPGMSWLNNLLRDCALHAGVRYTPSLIMFRKAMKTCIDVARELTPGMVVERTLARVFIERLRAEWGQRLFAPPTARHFATHLSNADIGALMVAGPLLLQRFGLSVAKIATR